jgi:hypothetical protein
MRGDAIEREEREVTGDWTARRGSRSIHLGEYAMCEERRHVEKLDRPFAAIHYNQRP